jgi:hypothetical protein
MITQVHENFSQDDIPDGALAEGARDDKTELDIGSTSHGRYAESHG